MDTPIVLFHLSMENLNGIVLKPRVPNNFLTKNSYEDNKTPRISFSKTIDGALAGIGSDLTNKVFFVHIIDEQYSKPIIKFINKTEVPDCDITDEVWVLNEIKLKCVRTIRVLKTISKKISYGKESMWSDKYMWEYVDILKVKNR